MIINHLSYNFPKDVATMHQCWLCEDEIVVFVALFSSDSSKTSCPKAADGVTTSTERRSDKGEGRGAGRGCGCLTCRLSGTCEHTGLRSVLGSRRSDAQFHFYTSEDSAVFSERKLKPWKNTAASNVLP